MFRAGLHDSDGDGAGLTTLGCLMDAPDPDELDAATATPGAGLRDAGELQENVLGRWLNHSITPDGAGAAGNRLRGGRGSVLHGDVGEAQSFTSVEDATTIDRPPGSIGVPYLPGRMHPAAITGEQGGFPT